MDTVKSFPNDDLSHDERRYIAQILYGCLSSVEMIKETDTLQAPNLLKAITPAHASGLSPIYRLQIKQAPGLSVVCRPLPPKVGKGNMTRVKKFEAKVSLLRVEPNPVTVVTCVRGSPC